MQIGSVANLEVAGLVIGVTPAASSIPTISRVSIVGQGEALPAGMNQSPKLSAVPATSPTSSSKPRGVKHLRCR
jgi:hypothetical protein